tara:strand:+ start:263 stop:1063 length:801 start_codon:yes stop_codon:yes gene_type:complete
VGLYAKETTDRMLLRQVLSDHALRASYMLGDLEPTHFRFTRWFIGAEHETAPVSAIAMLYTGLRLPVLLTHGNPHALNAALELAIDDLPGQIHLQIERPHDLVMGRYYEVDTMRSMLRMGLRKEDYNPVDVDAETVVQLGHQDTADLMELYGTTYPDAFFEPYQLEHGFYYGTRRDGRLVSAAGTHVFSEEFKVAAVGNVVTHPEYRGKQLATTTVAALLNDLFKKVDAVALNVAEENTSARHAFEHLGFKERLRFLEGGPATRRH